MTPPQVVPKTATFARFAKGASQTDNAIRLRAARKRISSDVSGRFLGTPTLASGW
jgi:hypothetical protein